MSDTTDTEALAAQLAQMQRQLTLLQQRPAQQPAIGASDTPHSFYQNRSAICLPPLERQDYEIKPELIALVERHQFHGLPAENPMEHIENYEVICSITKTNGVPEDYNKCKLFKFSLAEKAAHWLKSLPAGSLTSLCFRVNGDEIVNFGLQHVEELGFRVSYDIATFCGCFSGGLCFSDSRQDANFVSINWYNEDSRVIVVGDLHGQLHDLLKNYVLFPWVLLE